MDWPIPTRGREAGGGQPKPERGNLPETASSTKPRAGSQLLAKTWGSGWVTSARRVRARDQLPRGDTQHIWEGVPTAHPENQAAGTGVVIRRSPHLGRVHSPSNWSLELLGPGKGTKHRPKSAPWWSTREPEPEWLRAEKCMQPRARIRQFPCRGTWGLSSVDWESAHAVSEGKPSVAETLRALPTHASDFCLECSSLPTARLNKWA